MFWNVDFFVTSSFFTADPKVNLVLFCTGLLSIYLQHEAKRIFEENPNNEENGLFYAECYYQKMLLAIQDKI